MHPIFTTALGFSLAATLLGCRPATGEVIDLDTVVPPPPNPASASAHFAPAAAAPAASPVLVVAAEAPRADDGGLPAPLIAALSDQLREDRVFRHVLLGHMPSARVRDTWMMSRDGRRLTLVCEQADPDFNERGSPHPKRWYVVASATFEAEGPMQGRWPPRYRRGALSQLARPAERTACADLGERLEMTCHATTVRAHGPGAYVPTETRNDEPIRWQPSARRPVAGVGCEARGANVGGFVLGFYDFAMSDPRPPTIFFSDAGPTVERVVNGDAAQYNDYREATLEPFDGALPAHLRKAAP